MNFETSRNRVKCCLLPILVVGLLGGVAEMVAQPCKSVPAGVTPTVSVTNQNSSAVGPTLKGIILVDSLSRMRGSQMDTNQIEQLRPAMAHLMDRLSRVDTNQTPSFEPLRRALVDAMSRTNQPPEVTGLHVEGPSFLKENARGLEAKLKPFFGKPLAELDTAALQSAILVYSRELGYSLVDVSIPEQKISSGVVQVVVLEGRVGKLAVTNEGRAWFSSRFITNHFRHSPGDKIASKKLQDDVDWLNRNSAFREVEIQLKPGGGVGETDMTLIVKDRFPVSATVGYDDSGNKATGYQRLQTGVTWGNVFGLDHALSYSYSADPDFNYLSAHSVSYTMPLPWRHTLSFSGAYSETTPDMEALGLPGFVSAGESYQASLRYAAPLSQWGTWKHEVSLGADFKRIDNNLLFGGTTLAPTAAEVYQGVMAYNGQLPDRFGVTRLNLQAVYSPGGVGDKNTAEAFAGLRSGAAAEYGYARLAIDRQTQLPWNMTLSTRGTLQWAEGRLLPTEQLGAGGVATVRGYDEGMAYGDRGLLINTELRLPVWSPSERAGSLQLLAFLDYATISQKHPEDGEDPHANLASIGGGLRYQWKRNLSVRFDYGWQLLRDPSLYGKSSVDGSQSRRHFSVNLTF